MKNPTSLNVLVSYAYLYGRGDFVRSLRSYCEDGKVNLMIDSGAFTKFNSKTKKAFIDVREYTSWLKDYAYLAEKYVMLDVIGNAPKSRENYEYMLGQGLKPMYVATIFDKDYDYIRKAVSNNPDICVAGGATNKSDWMVKRFQDVYLQTDKKARMHGLGYFTFPKMLQLNLASVDSSSWRSSPQRFGQFVFFSYTDKKVHRILYRDIVKGSQKMPDDFKKLLLQYNITPKLFTKVGVDRGIASLPFFLSVITNRQLQKYCKRCGLDYFFALGSPKYLKVLVALDENPNMSYEEFVKICTLS